MAEVTFEKPLEFETEGEPEPSYNQYNNFQGTWAQQDQLIDSAIASGYQIRAIVTLKNLGQYQRVSPDNWGVIIRIDRYNKANPQACLVCKFVNDIKEQTLAPSELLVVYPAVSYMELIKQLKDN